MPYTNYSTPAPATPSSSTLFGRGAPAIAGGLTGPQMMRRALRGGADPTGRGMTPDQFSTAFPFLPAGWGQSSGPGYTSAGDPGSFANQNAMANAGVYQAGTFGADNAAANGTGAVLGPDGRLTMPATAGAPGAASPGVPKQMLAPGGGGVSPTPGSFTGSPDDQLALAMAFMRGGAPAGRAGKAQAPAYMNGGLDPGQFSAANAGDLTQDLAAGRVYSRDVAPFMPHPGMSPEAEANAVGYMNKLVLRANGIPEAPSRPMSTVDTDGWLRGAGASKPLSLTMPGVGGEMPPGVVMPTGYDANMMKVSRLASDARSLAARNTQPGIIDLGKDAYGRPVQGIRQPNGNIARLPGEGNFPRPVEVGGRKLTEVSAGKFMDEKGQPVAWKGEDEEKPLKINEFFGSQSVRDAFQGDYAQYRAAFEASAKAVKNAAAEAATAKPAGAAGAQSAPIEPSAKAVEFLIKNPAQASAFDAKFGAGSSARFIAPASKS